MDVAVTGFALSDPCQYSSASFAISGEPCDALSAEETSPSMANEHIQPSVLPNARFILRTPVVKVDRRGDGANVGTRDYRRE